MSLYVVDASVLVKWYIPEVHSAAAHQYLDPRHELIAPDLVVPETGNILWKKVRKAEITRADGDEIIAALAERMPLTVHPSGPLLAAAFRAGLEIGRTVYDSLYLVLAVAQGCFLVTADRKLFNAIAETPLRDHVRWVEDPPVDVAR